MQATVPAALKAGYPFLAVEFTFRRTEGDAAMDAELTDELLVVLVMHLDSGVTGEPLVDWATSALERGLDSPALTWLAGLPRSCSVFESAPLLDRALRELSLPPLPDPEGLRRAYVSAVSRQLLAGKLTPNEALDRVHRHAVSPL
ncbi:MAG TPA: hypothetical protein VFM14_06955, partial [Gemmatimonadales bacterium]|nr:hypothetical protein [Gemmatimonadales bacterium]